MAVDLELVADPQVNTVEQVLARTRTMELVIDSPAGLYAPGQERDDGDLRIADVDGDPALELVARVPVPDARFPRIRLERGGLPDVPLTLELVGYEDGPGFVVASGTLDGVTFGSGVADVAIPFNLLADELPPRVVDVIAEPTSGCVAPSLTILFSRAIDPGTLLGPGAIVFDPGGAPMSARIDAGGRLAVVTAPAAVVSAPYVRFSITLATSIATIDGVPLDQRPGAPGDQAYVGRFDRSCAP